MFHRRTRSWDGLTTLCKICVRAYYDANIDIRRRKGREHYEKTRENGVIRAREYRRIHQEDIKRKKRAAYAANVPANSVRQARRSAKKFGVLDALTLSEWTDVLILQGLGDYEDPTAARCAYCPFVGRLCMDHVIPFTKGGPNVQSNVVGSCKSCNTAKLNHDLRTFSDRWRSIQLIKDDPRTNDAIAREYGRGWTTVDKIKKGEYDWLIEGKAA